MGRSEQKDVNNESKSLLGTENSSAAQAKSLLMPGYTDMLKNPGYTPGQENSITNATEGGVGAAFGNAEQGAVNTAARTNNTAGLTSTEDALARQRMVTSGNLAATNETNFA